MAINGQPLMKLARNAFLAAAIGAGGSVLVNTVRRDSERAKKLLCYTAVAGLTGISVGCTYGAVRKQNLLAYSLSSGVSFFTISGMFFVAFGEPPSPPLEQQYHNDKYGNGVIRDNLLLSSTAHEWRRTIDEMQGNPTVTTRRETMSSMQASAVSGGATGTILSCVIWRGPGVLFLSFLQGVLIAVIGQWSVDKCRIWILEETIKYHYPELVANAKRGEESWENWMIRKLSGRSYGSLLKEKLRSYEIQLEILEEEEARLLRLIEERDNKTTESG